MAVNHAYVFFPFFMYSHSLLLSSPLCTPSPTSFMYTVDVKGTHGLQKVKQHGLKKIKKVGKLSKKLLKNLKKKTGKKLTEELRPLLELETLSSDSDGEAGRLKEVRKRKKQKSKGMKSVRFEDDVVQLLESASADDNDDLEVEVPSVKGKRKRVGQDDMKWTAELSEGATKQRTKGGRKQAGEGSLYQEEEEKEKGFSGKKEKEREARRARRAKKKVIKCLLVQCQCKWQDIRQCFNLHSKPKSAIRTVTTVSYLFCLFFRCVSIADTQVTRSASALKLQRRVSVSSVALLITSLGSARSKFPKVHMLRQCLACFDVLGLLHSIKKGVIRV